MVATKKWKLTHFEGGFRPILFDLENDPQELVDLGESPDHQRVIEEMYAHLHSWARRVSQRTTLSEAQLIDMRTSSARKGIVLGAYDESEVAADLTVKYRDRSTVPSSASPENRLTRAGGAMPKNLRWRTADGAPTNKSGCAKAHIMGRMRMRFLKTIAVAGAALLLAGAAQAQEFTFKLHHLLPAKAPAHTKMLEPWARAVEANADGRVKIEIYPAMTLGGRPPRN